ncbi:MAG: ABC transporter ATP-binding protein [Sulfolobaceae archaeon]|jgi:ABC-type multidrug transport system, ATPase component|nr:ABC transporter ATP-binding protein [Sulfolobales archaeon]
MKDSKSNTTDGLAVSVRNLRKSFKGKMVLREVTFDVREGEVFGIIGPNGAGKTTTLRILSGIITEYEGDVKIFGLTPSEAKLKGLMSYMPEESFPYERLTGVENLWFFAMIYAKGDKKLAEEYLERGIKIADLGDKINEKVSSYSRGMKRRLMIARTLMVKPRLAILDEPTTALDVISAVKIRETIKTFAKKENTTILLSSHNMLEVDFLCDRVALINSGQTVMQGTPKEIVEATQTRNLEEAFIKVTNLV